MFPFKFYFDKPNDMYNRTATGSRDFQFGFWVVYFVPQLWKFMLFGYTYHLVCRNKIWKEKYCLVSYFFLWVYNLFSFRKNFCPFIVRTVMCRCMCCQRCCFVNYMQCCCFVNYMQCNCRGALNSCCSSLVKGSTVPIFFLLDSLIIMSSHHLFRLWKHIEASRPEWCILTRMVYLKHDI